VLVVDDEPDIANLLMIWLEDDPRCAGVEVAHDLTTAMRSVEGRCPDTIVLDLFIGPDSSARGVPHFRRSCPAARIIVHTANRDAAHQQRVCELGADMVVEKASVSIDALIDKALAS
jgi:DNA-binding response OmpR family regulator